MKIEYEYQGGMTTETGYHRKYLHKATGIAKEVYTKRKNGRPVGNGELCFYHDNDKDSYPSFLQALNRAVELGLTTPEQAAPFSGT